MDFESGEPKAPLVKSVIIEPRQLNSVVARDFFECPIVYFFSIESGMD